MKCHAGVSGGVKSIIEHISSASNLFIDRSALRLRFSSEICALLYALLQPNAQQRPSIHMISAWPLFPKLNGEKVERAEKQSPVKQAALEIKSSIPSTSHERAANEIIRSFRRSLKKNSRIMHGQDHYAGHGQNVEEPIYAANGPRLTGYDSQAHRVNDLRQCS